MRRLKVCIPQVKTSTPVEDLGNHEGEQPQTTGRRLEGDAHEITRRHQDEQSLQLGPSLQDIGHAYPRHGRAQEECGYMCLQSGQALTPTCSLCRFV